MKKINFIITIAIVLLIAVLLSGCAKENSPAGRFIYENKQMKVYKVGIVAPLSGEAAPYGDAIQKMLIQSISDVNEKWSSKNMKLEFVSEDGKCSARDSLAAAQKLVDADGVKIIMGGVCSGETLGMAPFTDPNKVIVFSAGSSSPEISKAGDFVFRNYPSDTAQVSAMTQFIKLNGWKKVAILSENTDYAQALRKAYLEKLPTINVEIVADEIVTPGSKDVRLEAQKIKSSGPDAILILPQTPPMTGVFAKQLFELNIDAQGLGNEISGMKDSRDDFGEYLEGYYYPELYFKDEKEEDFINVAKEAGCEIGIYCATAYDSVTLIAQMIEVCGENTACISEKLYATQHWNGRFMEDISFDQNGDVGGSFKIYKIVGSERVEVQ